MQTLKRCCLLAAVLTAANICHAQYKGDHIPGFFGLDAGTQVPPGLYVGNIVWVYPTDTVKDNNGNAVTLPGSLTSTADIILLEAVTNYKILGGHLGASLAFPFIKNRIQFTSLDVNTGFAYTDMFGGLSLGWHLKRADVTVGYNLYMPTGSYSPSATDNTGLGMWGNELMLGSTVYFDQKRQWSAAGNFGLEFHTDKRDSNIHVGDLGTLEYGFARTFYQKAGGPIPRIINIGAAGYSQFKITGDSGSDIPLALRGFKDRVFALGPEFNIFLPKPRLTFMARYEPEFGSRVRAQGQTIMFSVVWMAKSLVKAPHP